MKPSLDRFKIFGVLGTIKYYLLVEFYYRMLATFGRQWGLSLQKRDVPVVVSLTTIPHRIDKVFLCIESLLRQSVKPDHVILWLSESERSIPKSLEKLEKRGLTIRFRKDIRSYTKIIYTLREYPGSLIVTADDDFFYPRGWLKDLFDAYESEPTFIHCHRAHLMAKDINGELKEYQDWSYGSPGFKGPSLLLFPTGAAGVLYPPGSLDEEVVNEKVFSDICPTADDVWLKAMSLLRGTLCKKVKSDQEEFIQIKGTQEQVLWRENVLNKKNDKQIRAVFQYYKLARFI